MFSKKNSFLLDDYPKTGQIEFQDFNNIDISLPSRCSMKQNVKKHDYFQNQNILNCDKNNSSRTCPILLCNFKKDKHCVDRVVKNLGNKKVFLDYRFNTKNCSNQYVGGESNQELLNADLQDSTYFKSIDHENDLLNIVNKIGCNRNFIPKCVHDNSDSNEDTTLSNVKENFILSNFDSKVDRYPQYAKNCINFRNTKYCPDGYLTNHRNPISNYQINEINQSAQRSVDKFLPIGPVRNDEKPCELPWNNFTKRLIPINYKKIVTCKPFVEPVDDKRANPNLMNSSYQQNSKITHKKGAFITFQSFNDKKVNEEKKNEKKDKDKDE